MKNSWVILLVNILFITSCEELSFSNDKSSSNEQIETETTPEPNQEESSNVDFNDTTPIECNGQYPINISAVTDGIDATTNSTLSYIIDGNKTNERSWISNSSSSELIFELDKKALLKHVVISWKSTNVSQYFDIDTSFDKETWTNLKSGEQSKKDYVIPELISFTGQEQTAHFIRLTLNGNNLDNENDIVEFEAYGCHQDTSHDIELIDWYLSVQTDTDGNGRSDSIKEDDLSNGYQDPRFFYISEDNGLVFTSSVQGYRTSENTKYVRSELREMLRRGNSNYKTQGVTKNNWVFSSAPQQDQVDAGGVDGTLDAELAVNQVTATGEDYQIGRVIIGQIHANDDEPVRLYYRKLPNNSKGSIYIAHELLDGDDTYYELIGSRDNDASNPSNGIALDEKFSYQIQVEGNELKVSVTKQDGETFVQTVDMTNSGYDQGGQYMYFKAGVYNQNNSGDLHDQVQATFYKIDNQHEEYQ